MSNTLKITKKGKKMFVNPRDLKLNPLNKQLYTNDVEEKKTQKQLADDFKKRVEQGMCPNAQPVMIWEDGLIDAGHTRTEAAIMAGVDIWVEFTDKPYPDIENQPYAALVSLADTNIHRKMTYSVKLNEFELMNKAYVKEFGINRTTAEEDAHIKKLETSRLTIKMLQEIKKNRPDLISSVDSGDMSVKSAWEESSGKNKPKVVKSNNPNRDWSQIYTGDIFRIIFNRVSNTINSVMDVSTKIDNEDYYPFKEFTRGSIAGIISHLIETIGSQVLKSEGYNVKCASGHPTDPDIYHIDIDDKVEIKVTNFNSASTSWKGGMGIREGQYVLVAYDESITRWLIIFTYLSEKDWKSAGMAGHTLPIKNVLENHKKDMVLICGDLYMNNGNLVAQLSTLK